MRRTRTLMLTALLGFAAYFAEPAAPKAILVTAPTEQSILQEMEREQKQKLYNRAALVAALVYRRNGCKDTYADATGRAAVDYGVSPKLLAGLVFIESSCDPDAASDKHSIGLAQINMTIWKYSRVELQDPERNLRIGASILASYVRQFGVVEGLHHYNGLGDATNEYSEKVLTAAN